MTTEQTPALPPASAMPAAAWADPQRSRFHFVSPAGWLNDPNGVGQWRGRFHLFYQYNPDAPRHAQIHWGHASSDDLVHWRDEPVALVPSSGADEEGCWSGVLVDDGGVPTLVYSGHHEGDEGTQQLACIAVGDPTLTTWTKYEGNPVIAARPEALTVTEFRDHCVWREGDEWRQLVGSGIRGQGGTALLYRSTDLREWDYLGPIVVGDASVREPIWTGSTWECVDLFELDGVWVLVFSAWDEGVTHYPLYYTGHYADGVFTPTGLHHLDYGLRHFYAPQSFRDESGRRIAFGWLQEARPQEASDAAGWSGVMSLPREWRIGPDGELWQQPVAEVASLRGAGVSPAIGALPAGESVWLEEVLGDELDIEARMVLEPGAAIELAVRATPDLAERTVIRIDAFGVLLDRSASSLEEGLDTVPLSGPVPVGENGAVELRVILDHSALEVFVNGRALSARIYPSRADALGVALGVVGGGVRVESLTAWTMESVWTGLRPLWP